MQAFARFVKGISGNVGPYDIESRLITPVQRLPRYRLLLDTLLQHTPKEQPEFTLLQDAVSLVGEIATDVNERMRDTESKSRLIRIANTLKIKVALHGGSGVGSVCGFLISHVSSPGRDTGFGLGRPHPAGSISSDITKPQQQGV